MPRAAHLAEREVLRGPVAVGARQLARGTARAATRSPQSSAPHRRQPSGARQMSAVEQRSIALDCRQVRCIHSTQQLARVGALQQSSRPLQQQFFKMCWPVVGGRSRGRRPAAPEGVDHVAVEDGHGQVEQAHGRQQHHTQRCAQLQQRRGRPHVRHRGHDERVPARRVLPHSATCRGANPDCKRCSCAPRAGALHVRPRRPAQLGADASMSQPLSFMQRARTRGAGAYAAGR